MSRNNPSLADPDKPYMPETTEQFRIAYQNSHETPTGSELRDAMSFFYQKAKENNEYSKHLNTLTLWINHIACSQQAQKHYYDNRVDGLKSLMEEKYGERMVRTESAWVNSYDAANCLLKLVAEAKEEIRILRKSIYDRNT